MALRRGRYLFSLLLLWFGVSGCVSYRPVARQSLPAGERISLSERIDPWWRLFGDAPLDRAVNEMLGRNLDLQSAASRVLQARYAMGKSRAARLPSLDLSVGVSRSVNHFDTGTIASNELSTGVRAAYELDLFGRLEDLDEAARQDWRQRRFDYEALAIAMSADLVENWYGVAYADESLRFLKRRIRMAEKELALLKKRYRAQRATVMDLFSQQSLVRQLCADRADLRYERKVYESAVAVLMAKDPRSFTSLAAALPEPIDAPLPDVDSEVLLRRPDIKAAYAALEALDRRAAAAVSAQYPRFSLSATLSDNDMRFNNLFDLWYTSVAATVLTPLFDGGSRESDAKIALERRREALLRLKQSLIEASGEVVKAVKSFEQKRRGYRLLRQRVALEAKKVASYQNAYLHGTEDYKRYLDAELSYLSLRMQEIRERYDLVRAAVGFYRVTASGWRRIEIRRDQHGSTGE
ncbi:MAG: TolC family protein [Epsilonproteobacteria bacterium]|nr:TolC family protein [Campylobacterota bacterium]